MKNRFFLILFYFVLFLSARLFGNDWQEIPPWIDFEIVADTKTIHGSRLVSIFPENKDLQEKLNEMITGASFDYFRDVLRVRVTGTMYYPGKEGHGLVEFFGTFSEQKIIEFLKTKLGDPVEEKFCGVMIYKAKDRKNALAFLGNTEMLLGNIENVKALIQRRCLNPTNRAFESDKKGLSSGELISITIWHPEKIIKNVFSKKTESLRQKNGLASLFGLLISTAEKTLPGCTLSINVFSSKVEGSLFRPKSSNDPLIHACIEFNTSELLPQSIFEDLRTIIGNLKN
ncbi:MAG: hypothetical protein HQM08_09225 [Candidatus Riflebacteria bacterium]|nr:hypothetical protein [Candidatus Riflebacteria bacterium]